MTKRMLLKSFYTFLFVSLLSLTNTVAVHSLEGEPSDQFVLEGLESVHVSISDLDKLRLDRGVLRKTVESKLANAGMKIIGEKEFLNYTDVDQLLVKVKTLKHKKQLFYSLQIELNQMVFLEGKPSRKISVTSFSDQVLGLADTKTEDLIQKRISERIDNFISLWRRANK